MPDDNDIQVALESLRTQVVADPEVPEMIRRFLEKGALLEDIRLDAGGVWRHRGEPFLNTKLIALFHRSLQRTEAGTWLLFIDPYTYPVQVDGVGSFVERLLVEDGKDIAVLASKERVEFVRDSFVTDGDRFVGVTLTDGRLARLMGSAYQNRMSTLAEVDGGYTVDFDGDTLALGAVDEALLGTTR